ncbi:Carboxylic ester hydrolase [Meloidogyne graminicola]|uniref:Carboxylic ester hydrolase n=1 Tax=Meloidogyne graminicola TaxID=189291 RepID=A0A8T0A1L7_9BILA|nr:Carboxylic ester hydrolase [Meloidogyne graminicola]
MLVEIVSSFVIKGKPTVKGINWKQATKNDPSRYLLINGSNSIMKENVFEEWEKLRFWHKLTETHHEFNLINGVYGKSKKKLNDEF